jgi:hypothetical protein
MWKISDFKNFFKQFEFIVLKETKNKILVMCYQIDAYTYHCSQTQYKWQHDLIQGAFGDSKCSSFVKQ